MRGLLLLVCLGMAVLMGDFAQTDAAMGLLAF